MYILTKVSRLPLTSNIQSTFNLSPVQAGADERVNLQPSHKAGTYAAIDRGGSVL
jgi:hypothetical protein